MHRFRGQHLGPAGDDEDQALLAGLAILALLILPLIPRLRQGDWLRPLVPVMLLGSPLSWRQYMGLVALDSLGKFEQIALALAGFTVAQTLRSGGFAGEIVMVGQEPHRPYDRPPLSKGFLVGELTMADLAYETDESRLDVTWRLGVAAVGLDVANRTLLLGDGSTVGGDELVSGGPPSSRSKKRSTSTGPLPAGPRFQLRINLKRRSRSADWSTSRNCLTSNGSR